MDQDLDLIVIDGKMNDLVLQLQHEMTVKRCINMKINKFHIIECSMFFITLLIMISLIAVISIIIIQQYRLSNDESYVIYDIEDVSDWEIRLYTLICIFSIILGYHYLYKPGYIKKLIDRIN
jgi:hypothetical protein